jgi:hypothetical protein
MMLLFLCDFGASGIFFSSFLLLFFEKGID